MKREYERPVIKKLQSGVMNKFGRSPFYTRKIRPEIYGVPVSVLVERFGSPLFVFSESALRRRYREMYTAFSTRYPNVTFGWSYKTNHLQAICAILHREGALAEVVSRMEYEKARALGVPGEKIILNGPRKPRLLLERALRGGAMVNLDHFDEIHDLEQVADALGRRLGVGMRLSMDTGIHPQWSRFGMNLDTGQAMDAAKRIAKGGKLVINGLHSHIGTFIMEPAAYGRQVEKMVAFAYELEKHFGFTIEYLDIGGGFPSRIRLKGAYLAPDVGLPGIEEYAEQITGALWRTLRPGDFPRLIIESGRAVVDEAGSLITTVHASKRLADGTRAYVVDAGVNLLFTAFWYKFDIALDREVPGPNEPCVIYGPLCMNIDVLDEGTQLPPLPRGTRLVFSPVGAYNTSQWLQFIEYRPNVVLIGEDGEVDLIREAEELSDIVRRERLPERLALDAADRGNGIAAGHRARRRRVVEPEAVNTARHSRVEQRR